MYKFWSYANVSSLVSNDRSTVSHLMSLPPEHLASKSLQSFLRIQRYNRTKFQKC